MATTLTPNLKLRVADDLTSDAVYNLNRIDTVGSTTLVDNAGNLRLRSRTNVQIQPQSTDIGGSGSGGTVTVGEAGTNVLSFDVYADSVDFHGAALSNVSISWSDIDFTSSDASDIINIEAVISANSDVTANTLHAASNDNVHGVTGSVVGTSDSQVLTNKTIDADDNVLSNIADSNISATAAIDASKIGDGSVSNLELSYLSGATSNLQAQINTLGGANQLAASWTPADGLVKTITHGFGSQNIAVQILDTNDSYATISVDRITRPNSNDVVLVSSELPATSWMVLVFQVGG